MFLSSVRFIWVKSVYPAEFLAFKRLNKLVVLNVALLLQLQEIPETLQVATELLTFNILKYFNTTKILEYYITVFCNTADVLWCSCCKTIKRWSSIKIRAECGDTFIPSAIVNYSFCRCQLFCWSSSIPFIPSLQSRSSIQYIQSMQSIPSIQIIASIQSRQSIQSMTSISFATYIQSIPSIL